MIALALAALLALAPAAVALERLPAVVHVHSTVSTGDLTLDQVAELAEQERVGAVLFAENYLLRVAYGLAPFRALTRVAHERPSVLRMGPERYLSRLAEAAARHPNVLLLPGVEVMPHYFWTGSPLLLDLRLHDLQKNVLVFGLTDAAQLRGLPVTGNPAAGRFAWDSAIELAPGGLLVVGLAMLRRKRPEARKLLRSVVVVHRRRWGPALFLCAVGGLALVRAWPFTSDAFPAWRDAGVLPHQTLIDAVDRLGGVTVWSFPEAADVGQHRVGPVRVSWKTEPYADDLFRTFRYTGFGGLYEQPTRFTQPGGGWDRLLAEHAAGQRRRAPWALGESGFHGGARGKRLGVVQTVFLVGERTSGGVLDALRNGRLYAVRRVREAGLVLADFAVTAGGATAISGGSVAAAAGTTVEVRLGVEATDAGPYPVRIALVKNGTVASVWAPATPFRAVYRETSDGTPAVYRLEIRGPVPHHLVSSPIFVRRP